MSCVCHCMALNTAFSNSCCKNPTDRFLVAGSRMNLREQDRVRPGGLARVLQWALCADKNSASSDYKKDQRKKKYGLYTHIKVSRELSGCKSGMSNSNYLAGQKSNKNC